MNALGLRVSSVKTGVNRRKNAAKRSELAQLPKHYEKSKESYCVALQEAKTIAEQNSAIKNIFRTLGSDANALQFLTDMFFYLPLKHPVRSQILKLLITASKVGSIDEKVVVGSLAQSELRLIDETKRKTESAVWNNAVASLSGCFENFKCGLESVALQVSKIFSFLRMAMDKYLEEMKVVESPAVLNEYYLFVHNVMRLVLCIVQEFGAFLIVSNPEEMKMFFFASHDIMANGDIPMDPRTNCGIFTVMVAKMTGDYTKYVEKLKGTIPPEDIAKLYGVIITLTQQEYETTSVDIRDICAKIDELSNAHNTEPHVLLCGTRILFHMSKLLVTFDISKPAVKENSCLILRRLLIYTFHYLEHHMDSVRHICRSILRNTIIAAKKIEFTFLLKKIYDACTAERLSVYMKCIVLQQVIGVMGADSLRESYPSLFRDIFYEHLGVDGVVTEFFEVMMKTHHKEVPYEQWFDIWVNYLLNSAKMWVDRAAKFDEVVANAISYEPRILEYLVDEANVGVLTSTKLNAFWTIRRTGIKIEHVDELMAKFSNTLKLCILSTNDDERILVLKLLVDTHKTAAPFNHLDIELLLEYCEYNLNCQSSAIREKTLATLTKALQRCELNLMAALKSLNQPLNYEFPPAPLRFLRCVMNILVRNFYKGANFSRRVISLTLFEQSVRICLNCKLDLNEMFPPGTVAALAGMLDDTYECNKVLAVNALVQIEDTMGVCLIKEYDLEIDVTLIKDLLLSNRPMESITGTYMLDFYCRSSEILNTNDTPAYNALYFRTIRWLLLLLKDGISTAQKSIARAAHKNPLYGVLFAINHFLTLMDFKMMAKDIQWRILIAELILLCKDLTSIVGPVVNDDSPEGYLPKLEEDNDSENCEASESSDSAEVVEATEVIERHIATAKDRSRQPNAQAILLCAWRVVKEVSLMLGEIVLRSPIQLTSLTEEFLITKEQIMEIGSHFKDLLTEMKHRGAFEQAYLGFLKLCSRLWSVENEDLCKLPFKWLVSTLDLISKQEKDAAGKLCATRRSAGLPPLLQAIIISELKVGTTVALTHGMTRLFQFCKDESLGVETRTHALNILRTLFRCSDLNEVVGPFVVPGIEAAFNSYGADNWAVRNAGTLLFSALVIRIFGVQLTKDSENLNIRNKMTGRIFFLRYPALYDSFLEELHLANEQIKEERRAPKLQPLLLILSRLYPSALDGTESYLKMYKFVPLIASCLKCPDMQTRILAARAIANLVPKDLQRTMILAACSRVTIAAKDLNFLHSQLLKVKYLLRTCKTCESELADDIVTTLVKLHKTTEIKNGVIVAVICDILIDIANRVPMAKNLAYFMYIQNWIDEESACYYPVVNQHYLLYTLHICRVMLPFGSICDQLMLITKNTRQVAAEQMLPTLRIIALLLAKDVHARRGALLCFEIEKTQELEFVESLKEKILTSVATELRSSKQLYGTLKILLEDKRYHPDGLAIVYTILSMMDHFDLQYAWLREEARKQPIDLTCAITMCINRIILADDQSFNDLEAALEYIYAICDPTKPTNLRHQASVLLSATCCKFPTALSGESEDFTRLYINCMLRLLMDEDTAIRKNCSTMVLSTLPDCIGIGSCVSTMAVRLFLQYTAELLLTIKSRAVFVTQVIRFIIDALLLMELGYVPGTTESDDDDESEGKSSAKTQKCHNELGATFERLPDDDLDNFESELDVFDRNKANAYAEPMQVIYDALKIFKITFTGNCRVYAAISHYQEYLSDITCASRLC